MKIKKTLMLKLFYLTNIYSAQNYITKDKIDQIKKDNNEYIQQYVEKFRSIDAKNEKGNTLLFETINKKEEDYSLKYHFVKSLIENGANTKAITSSGKTALEVAGEKRQMLFLRLNHIQQSKTLTIHMLNDPYNDNGRLNETETKIKFIDKIIAYLELHEKEKKIIDETLGPILIQDLINIIHGYTKNGSSGEIENISDIPENYEIKDINPPAKHECCTIL